MNNKKNQSAGLEEEITSLRSVGGTRDVLLHDISRDALYNLQAVITTRNDCETAAANAQTDTQLNFARHVRRDLFEVLLPFLDKCVKVGGNRSDVMEGCLRLERGEELSSGKQTHSSKGLLMAPSAPDAARKPLSPPTPPPRTPGYY